MPIVEISVNEEELLGFEEGFTNLLKWLGLTVLPNSSATGWADIPTFSSGSSIILQKACFGIMPKQAFATGCNF